MQETPKANRIHIGIFGKRNVGKSTLMNALTRQTSSIVSDVAGTTTDSVYRNIEFHPIGPVVFIDTPGIDDEGELGQLRVQKAKKTLEEVDCVLWVHNGTLTASEKELLHLLKVKNIPYLCVYNIKKEMTPPHCIGTQEHTVRVNAKNLEGLNVLREALTKRLNQEEEKLCIGDLIKKGDRILLVTPQDVQAPKGRLILAQVQILRELLDKKAIPLMTTYDTLKSSLEALVHPPDLVITDSQLFKEVKAIIPATIPLTSFSILLARQKGDLNTYRQSIKAIGELKANDKVLISESCTHNPLHEDIARVKIPRALRKKCGHPLAIEWVSGQVFPEDLTAYKLIIQCGGCMQTTKQIENRINAAKKANVPITNFGVVLAYLSGILDEIWIG